MVNKPAKDYRGFRVSARTILQLGGELISSDGIAFYELIKNAVDAGSKKVYVDIVMRIPLEAINAARAMVARVGSDDPPKKTEIAELKKELINGIIADSPDASSLAEELRQASTLTDLLEITVKANSITFRDTGSGMTLDDLNSVYLTVGTPHRLKEREELREAGSKRVVLGEKGIGRLSTMRLGGRLFVRTSTEDESYWNELEINWADFGDPDQLLDDVEVAPKRGEKKDKPAQGTTIVISDLNATWTLLKLNAIANGELSRFTDPFAEKAPFPIHLRFSGTVVAVPRMSEVLRDNAHAIVEATLQFTPSKDGRTEACLSGKVQYLISGSTGSRLSGHTLDFSYSDDELASLLKIKDEPDIDLDSAYRLGSFSMSCLWFNRRIIKSIEVDDKLLDLKKLVRQWSGGLMVYRDGYRVPPYGSADDDWLDLDRGALAAQGYKVNRAQLIGKVDISANENPRLRDQTNREGLRDCVEKRTLGDRHSRV